MPRFLADQNFNGHITSGLRLKCPRLTLLRTQDTGLSHAPDPDVLAWAAQMDFILLTHDLKTIPGHAYAHVERGLPMPGVFVMEQNISIGRAIDDLLLIASCTEPEEWRNRIIHLPL